MNWFRRQPVEETRPFTLTPEQQAAWSRLQAARVPYRDFGDDLVEAPRECLICSALVLDDTGPLERHTAWHKWISVR